jgi:uncharacterized protein involved in type VI secretion and phage assembly
MKPMGPFAIPAQWPFGAQLARVTSVTDREGLGRVQVRLIGPDAHGDALIWARVAVPFAGGDRGAFFIPDYDDEVLVVFVAGNMNAPIVIGGLWNGAQKPPETIPGDRVDRWTITGKAGSRIAIIEMSAGSPTIELETPAGVKATLTDAGNKIELIAGENRITMDEQGVTVNAGAKVSVSASQAEVTAGQVTVNTSLATFSGAISCQTLQATAVISGSYSLGAGNVW